MTLLISYDKSKSLGSRGSIFVRLRLKKIDGRKFPVAEPAVLFYSANENLPGPDKVKIDRLRTCPRFHRWWCMTFFS